MAQRLDSAGISYMVSGSIAMNYYAVPRMTRDIDIVVELHPSDVDPLVALFGDDFYCDPDAVREAVETRGMFDASRALMRAGLRQREGVTDPGEERIQLFLRTYGAELDHETVRLIAKFLRRV